MNAVIPAAPAHIVIDGYICDAETGEVLGLVDKKTDFRVDSAEAVDWVLNKMLEAEAKVAAIDKTDAVIHARAVIANATAMKSPLLRRQDWLHARFDEELGNYARQALEGKKERTLKTLYGSISLRINKGGLRLREHWADQAVLLCKALGWTEAVKTTESFLISYLTPEHRAELEAGIASGELDRKYDEAQAFQIVPDREAVTVRTGVGNV